MDRCCKQIRVVLHRTEVPYQFKTNSPSDHLSRSSRLDLQGPHVAGNKEEFLTEAGREDWRGSDSSRCVNADFSQLKSEDVDKKLDVKLDSSDCRDGRAESPLRHRCFEPPELPHLSSRDGERDGGLSGQSEPQPWGLSAPVKEETAAFDSGQAAKNPLSCFFCGTEFATGGLLTRHVLIHTGESLLRCIICKRTFALEAELVSHVCARESSRRHQSGTEAEAGAGRLFPCSQCGEEFSRREELNVHLRSHARGDPLKCSVCQAVCSDRDSLILHMRIHTRQTQFSCSVCGKDFAWRRHLTKHMEVHMKRKKVFRCRVCGGEFCTYYVLSKHKLIHQPPELHQGQTEESGEDNDHVEAAAAEEDCGGPEGVTNPDPGRHLQPQTDAEASVDFKAEDQEFLKDPGASGSELTPEQPSEAPESDIKTDIQQLAVKEDLTEEVKQEEPEPPQVKEEPEETEVTTFTFGSVPVKTEEDEKKPQPWQLYDSRAEDDGGSAEQPEPAKNADSAGLGALSCKSDDSADSDFWKEARGPQSGLNSESDSGKNPLSGPEDKPSGSLQPESDDSVDSDFWKDYKKPQASSNPLKQDAAETGVKYVNDLKPYSCTLCSKAFRYSSYLKTHMRQHTERYFCSVCGYRSTSSSNLKVHMRTHTGEKPFSCPVCDKKYTNKASMQSHMSVHAAERKYSCEVCKKSFAWYTELKYHQCPGEASHHETYEEDANINLKRNVSYS